MFPFVTKYYFFIKYSYVADYLVHIMSLIVENGCVSLFNRLLVKNNWKMQKQHLAT